MKLPQLSLRDLFWLTALVAVSLGWYIDRRNFRHAEKVLLEMVTEARAEAEAASYRADGRPPQ